MTRWLTAFGVVWTMASPPAWASDGAVALAIGYPHAPGKESLRYPGWDAARFVETIAGVFDPTLRHPQRYLLLADFRQAADRDMFGHLSARPPTRAALDRAVDDLNRELDSLHASGHTTHFYVFYAGHGDVGEGNMGQVYLRPEGRDAGPSVGDVFTANDLWRSVLERARADRVHLMVDACNATFLMRSRGGTRSARAARRQGRIGRRFGDRLPQVGVVLSTSGVANVYESRVLQGGLFSHALRSGLAGAADFDGSVSDAELEGFVRDAFRAVDNPDRFAPDVYVQPPRLDAEWDAPWTRVAAVPSSVPGRHMLFDPAGDARHVLVDQGGGEHGLPIAEYHADASTPVTLRLGRSPQAQVAWRLGPDGGRTAWRARGAGEVVWRPAGPGDGDLSPRGAADDVAHQMFARPSGRTRVDALTAARARQLRDADALELARERYAGLRLEAGRSVFGGAAFDALPAAVELELAARIERRRIIWGVAGRFRAPTGAATPESEGSLSTYGGALAAVVGRVWPVGPIAVHPELAAGPTVLTQSGGGTAWGVQADAGVTAMVPAPWGSGWALALYARGGPIALWQVADAEDGARGWSWTAGIAVDLEVAS